ncbi:hypothetical protein FIU87_01205 [Bacillus sp. THAF10]|uniref:T6SS immunity protein Tdi1 domain-containing protein n=1 Tax=Bacillus sp. THAF10 TaxID=2587848 RepID=UPI0012694BE8|nr:T6SS immunity protein Tdi1 domain-containing protein [Bacillus sp. THAF10]QFT87269.1 hypothetical protein FIU87_01205 [Bacillus sp. THAF10]
MFQSFQEFFRIKDYLRKNYNEPKKFNNLQKNTKGFIELFSKYEGFTFGSGLYRLHKLNNIEHWNKIILQAFPEFENRIECFGYDWLGRQFALDKGRLEAGEAQILMLEPGTSEALEIPCSFIDFHNEEIVEYHNACLASSFYEDWKFKDPKNLLSDECIGYKVLLFLGGSDTISNLEKVDMNVYWNLCAQIITQSKDLPQGTKLKDFHFEN